MPSGSLQSTFSYSLHTLPTKLGCGDVHAHQTVLVKFKPFKPVLGHVSLKLDGLTTLANLYILYKGFWCKWLHWSNFWQTAPLRAEN